MSYIKLIIVKKDSKPIIENESGDKPFVYDAGVGSETIEVTREVIIGYEMLVLTVDNIVPKVKDMEV